MHIVLSSSLEPELHAESVLMLRLYKILYLHIYHPDLPYFWQKEM